MPTVGQEQKEIGGVTSERLIEEATRRIVDSVHPVRVILFGSVARGDGNATSDLDLIVLADGGGRGSLDRPARRALWLAAERSLRGLGVPRDIVVMTPEEFEHDRHVPGTVARPASLEGRVLYERAA